jgi:hypothetical protein
MGKKPKWLGAVKKVFSPESKDEVSWHPLAAPISYPLSDFLQCDWMLTKIRSST